MAVNSKADKTHALKSTGEKKPAYVALPAPPTGVQNSQAAHAMGGPVDGKLGMAGQKALTARAKKVLAPLADPTQAPFAS